MITQPLEKRMELIREIVGPTNLISVCPTYDNELSLFQSVKEEGLEGIVKIKQICIGAQI